MSWLSDLRRDIARTTADESEGLITFREPPQVYAANEIGIYGLVMPENPARVVCLSLNVLDELVDTIVAAQFRFRAENDDALDLVEEALSQSWTARHGGTLGTTSLIMSRWASGASLGQDSSNRITRSVNYYLTVERQLRHRN